MLPSWTVVFFSSTGLRTTQVRWPFDWLQGRLRLRFLELEADLRVPLCSSSLGRLSQVTVRVSVVPGVSHSRLTLHQPDVLDTE